MVALEYRDEETAYLRVGERLEVGVDFALFVDVFVAPWVEDEFRIWVGNGDNVVNKEIIGILLVHVETFHRGEEVFVAVVIHHLGVGGLVVVPFADEHHIGLAGGVEIESSVARSIHLHTLLLGIGSGSRFRLAAGADNGFRGNSLVACDSLGNHVVVAFGEGVGCSEFSSIVDRCDRRGRSAVEEQFDIGCCRSGNSEVYSALRCRNNAVGSIACDVNSKAACKHVHHDIAAIFIFALFAAVGVAENECEFEHLLFGVGDAVVGADVGDSEAELVCSHKFEFVFVTVVSPFWSIFPVAVAGALCGDYTGVGIAVGRAFHAGGTARGVECDSDVLRVFLNDGRVCLNNLSRQLRETDNQQQSNK